MNLISDFSRGRAAPKGPAVLTTRLQLLDSKVNCAALPFVTVPGRKGELLFSRHFSGRGTEVHHTLKLVRITGNHILGTVLKYRDHLIDCVDVLNKARPIGKSHTKAQRILIRYLRAYLARREQQLKQPRLLHREHLMRSPDEMEHIPYLSVPSASSVGEGSNLIFERVYDEVQGANMLRLRPVHVAHPLFPTLTRTRMVMIACGDILDASRPIEHLSRDQRVLIEYVRTHLARSSQMTGYVSPRIRRVAGKR